MIDHPAAPDNSPDLPARRAPRRDRSRLGVVLCVAAIVLSLSAALVGVVSDPTWWTNITATVVYVVSAASIVAGGAVLAGDTGSCCVRAGGRR